MKILLSTLVVMLSKQDNVVLETLRISCSSLVIPQALYPIIFGLTEDKLFKNKKKNKSNQLIQLCVSTLYLLCALLILFKRYQDI